MCAEITYEGLQHWGPVGLLDPQELINLGHGESGETVQRPPTLIKNCRLYVSVHIQEDSSCCMQTKRTSVATCLWK